MHIKFNHHLDKSYCQNLNFEVQNFKIIVLSFQNSENPDPFDVINL